nr:DUF2085 domain-containing protein [uncultured Methanobacterium sp.]
MISGEFRASNLICHRIPERTFNIQGKYFPVCARCTGFYIGAFSYFIYAYFFYVEYTVFLTILAILMIVPAFLDGFTQVMGTRISNNKLRLLTGLLGGVGLAIFLKTIKWMILVSY